MKVILIVGSSVIVLAVMLVKVVTTVGRYMDDSFRWGGRDGK